MIQRYETARESVIYCRPRVVAQPVSGQCAQNQANEIQARRDEDMWSTQRMNRLFEPPPTYPPTDLVGTCNVLAGLVKFCCCVIYIFHDGFGIPFFDFEESFYFESGRLLWRTTTSTRPSSYAGVYFIGISPSGVNPGAGGTIPAKPRP